MSVLPASFSSFPVIELASADRLSVVLIPLRTGWRTDWRSRLDALQNEVHEASQIIQGLVMDKPLSVGLVHQVGIAIPADIDETDDLVVAQLLDGIVDPPLVETEPVVVRFTERPDAKAITVDADAGPFAKPRPYLRSRANPGQ